MKIDKNVIKAKVNEVCRTTSQPLSDDCKEIEKMAEIGRRALKFFKAYEIRAKNGLKECEKRDINSKIRLFIKLFDELKFSLKQEDKNAPNKDFKNGKRIYKVEHGLVVEHI